MKKNPLMKLRAIIPLAAIACLPCADAALTATLGGFEDGLTDQELNVAGWFESSTGGFVEWTNLSTSIVSDPADGYTASRHLAMRGDGYVYQSIGIYNAASGTSLQWSIYQGVFTDGVATAGFVISYFAGAFPGAGEGVNIATAGLPQIGSTVSLAPLGSGFNAVSGAAAAGYRTGVVDLSSLTDGTEVWVRIGGTGGAGAYAPVDNFSVAQVPEPATGLLSLLGTVALFIRKRR